MLVLSLLNELTIEIIALHIEREKLAMKLFRKKEMKARICPSGKLLC